MIEDLLIIEDDLQGEDILILEDDSWQNNILIPEGDGASIPSEVGIPSQETEPKEHAAAKKPWTVVIVDDEPGVHKATQMALRTFTFEGRSLEFVSAYSGQEAKQLIAQLNDEAAFILLDVVMENGHAGLDVVEYIRNSLNNHQIRIILRTGQPGETPAESVILKYDINDYQLKVDLTRQRLITSIVTALRSYRDIVTIEHQRRELTHALEQLQTAQTQLKEYSFNLEIQVSKRTAELQEANDQLRRLANLDGLTKVANRRCFDLYYKEQWQHLSDHHKPLSLMMLDVDYFKRYNDQLGHLQGDDCLKQVADAISAALGRPEDLVARYGGEEFVVLLPNTSQEGCHHVVSTIFKQVQQLQMPHPDSEVSDLVTVSAGIAWLMPQPNIARESLIEMADIALYQSKNNGRNQFTYYSA